MAGLPTFDACGRETATALNISQPLVCSAGPLALQPLSQGSFIHELLTAQPASSTTSQILKFDDLNVIQQTE